MVPIRPGWLFIFILFLFFQPGLRAFSQSPSYPVRDWVKQLNVKYDHRESNYLAIRGFMYKADSAIAFATLDEMQREGASASRRFHIRLKMLRALSLFDRDFVKSEIKIESLIKEALQEAYELDDEIMVANVVRLFSELMIPYRKIAPAVMYALNAAEMQDKLGLDKFRTVVLLRWKLGEILYHAREYEKSIFYTRQAIEFRLDTLYRSEATVMGACNTIGLAWQKLGQYDSAFAAYEKGMQIAIRFKNDVWKGIISGNKGQIYFLQHKYDIAKPLLEMDYRASKDYGELDNAANSLQWIAKINLLKGKKDSALLQVKEAMSLLQKKPQINYLQNIYYTTADVYRALGNTDSFYHYFQLYNVLHDSLERAVAVSNIEIARIRLNNEEGVHKLRILQKEKTGEELKRNFIIAVLVLVAFVTILILNRQRLKLRLKEQSALQQQIMAEAEVTAAKEQLHLFRQSIIEKTSFIEKLQQQAQDKELRMEQQELIDELRNQTILTEDDWEKFKILFEKIYPGFFINLKEKTPDITLAEQRMAALTRLHLSVRQMASILGISPDSVHKTRQRLRQRFQLGNEINLEEFVTLL